MARDVRHQLPPQPAGYCTWYAEKHGGACDEKHLAELAAFAARNLKPFGFEFVQIDDELAGRGLEERPAAELHHS